MRELRSDASQLAIDIIEARAYAKCKAVYDACADERDERLDPWRDSPMLDLVIDITRELYLGRRVRTGFKQSPQSPIILTDKD